MEDSREAFRAKLEQAWAGRRVGEDVLLQRVVHVSQAHVVAQGWDTVSGRSVCIKVPLKQRSAYPEVERERLTLEQLRGVVGPQVWGLEQLGQRPALLMEWVEGRALSEFILLRRGAPRAQFYWVMSGLAGKLERMHARGMAHLSVSARAVILGAQLRLLDFGRVRHEREPHPAGVYGGKVSAVDVRAFALLACQLMESDWEEGMEVPQRFAHEDAVPEPLRGCLERALGAVARRPDIAQCREVLARAMEQTLRARAPAADRSAGVASTDEWARQLTRKVQGSHPALLHEQRLASQSGGASRGADELLGALLRREQTRVVQRTHQGAPSLRERLLSHIKENVEDS